MLIIMSVVYDIMYDIAYVEMRFISATRRKREICSNELHTAKQTRTTYNYERVYYTVTSQDGTLDEIGRP